MSEIYVYIYVLYNAEWLQISIQISTMQNFLKFLRATLINIQYYTKVIFIETSQVNSFCWPIVFISLPDYINIDYIFLQKKMRLIFSFIFIFFQFRFQFYSLFLFHFDIPSDTSAYNIFFFFNYQYLIQTFISIHLHFLCSVYYKHQDI